jgi:hypothetical protein
MRPTKKISSNAGTPQRRMKEMKQQRLWVFALALVLTATGCAANYGGQMVGSAPILQAQRELPEDQLLDVGLVVFESEPITPQQAEKEGTSPEVRQSETHFMPYHLKQGLQQSGHWGAVRVIPHESASVDVRVTGKILESNGEILAVDVQATDSTGKVWIDKVYAAQANEYSYSNLEPGKKDAFQDVYNAIANDVARHRMSLTPEEVKQIRTVTRLKFAVDFAPSAYSGYLGAQKAPDGVLTVKRLPAEDDPMMGRLSKVREREAMYVDTLNEFYDNYYNLMWPSYENWRSLNLQERQAIKKVKQEALTRQILGLLMVAGAVALAAGDVEYTGALQAGLVIMGGQVFIDGINITQQADMHSAAIKELSESFGSEMKPIVIEFEGKQYELTGTAQEQFQKWRQLLKQIHAAETGFDLNEPDATQPDG